MQFVKFNFFMLRSFRLPSYKINFVGSSSFEKIPGTELCLFDIFQIAEPSDGLKMRGGGGPYLWGEHNVHLHTLVEIGLTVTENPREIARERLLRRLPTTSSGKVGRRFLIDVPIGNTKNAKTLQINKL